MRPLIIFVLLASPLRAADSQVHRDLAYAEPKNERQTLDVYASAEGTDHPIVIWIEGDWRACEKAGVMENPQAYL